MNQLLTIEAEYICRKCNQSKGIHHDGVCAFRSCGNEYCDRVEDLDAIIFKLLGDDYNSDNGDKTVQEQSKN